MVLTKEEFKEKWNSINGGGVTFDDIADCAKDWGLYQTPRIHDIHTVANDVLIAAGCEKHFKDGPDNSDS